MFPRLAILALMTLPLAACDTQVMTDLRRGVGLDDAAAQPEEPTGPRPPAVSPLEQPIETAGAAPRPPRVSARGGGPRGMTGAAWRRATTRCSPLRPPAGSGVRGRRRPRPSPSRCALPAGPRA